jgi:MFS family permease
VIVLGSAIGGGIYVVCPAMLGEFAPTAQRGAVISIYGAIYTLAGIIAPLVMGSIVDSGDTPLDGFLLGFKVLAGVLMASGALSLPLLWPNLEKQRLATVRAAGASHASARRVRGR